MAENRATGRTVTRNQRSVGALILFIILCTIIYFNVGLFVVQPIGACPDGQTIVFWRGGEINMPFLSSADGLLLDDNKQVSLFGRGIVLAAVGNVIEDRIITRLPYFKWLYLQTTGGREFVQ